MTFYIISAAMVAVALLLIVRPLFKSTANDLDNVPAKNQKETLKSSSRGRILAAIVVALLIPLTTTLLYRAYGRPNWQEELAAAQATQQPANSRDVEAMIAKLEARLRDQPNDIEGWTLLGRSYIVLEKIPMAISAYEKAYAQSKGNSLDATLGLAEALVFADEKSLGGRAGELFDAVLAKEPNNPKALWYGAVSELSRGNLPSARDRLQRMLTMNPPENIRSILERQVQDINQQLAEAGAQPQAPSTTPPKAAQVVSAARSLQVNVTIAGALAKDLSKSASLFVLARDPSGKGAPLAVKRLTAGELPLSITLSDSDAMIQGHGIGSVEAVQVVARISKSGMPQPQSGDFYGETAYTFASSATNNQVRIVIDRTVP